ncbi:MAG: hypothetical protein EBU04_08690 [Verrucomicrobia bacterium]|nr:hypothetical protein [Verrucomicrobiota bacterium]
MKTILLSLLAFTFGGFAAETASPKPYPLDKCIVSDEKLGEEGKPVVFIHEGQEIKLCCRDCRKDFDANPAKFLAKLPKADDAPKIDKDALHGRAGFLRLPRPDHQGLLQGVHREVRKEPGEIPEKTRRQISLPKPRRSGVFYWAGNPCA